MGLGGSDTDSYCPGTGATAILASCLRSLGKGVGVNYNQTVKAIHTNFNDRRAVALLARLEKYTQELTLLFGQVVRLAPFNIVTVTTRLGDSFYDYHLCRHRNLTNLI